MSEDWSGMEDFEDMMRSEEVDIVAPDGTVRCRVKAQFAGTIFIIKDKSADVQVGDEIRRMLPNGKEDVFLVKDPTFYSGGPFGAHYQVKISRRGSFEAKTGGHYIHVSGDHSRVNVQSTDNSVNISGSNVFGQARAAIASQIADPAVRVNLTKHLDDVEASNSKDTFISAYQRLISSAADHITVLTPFLPAITQLLHKLA